MATTTSIIPSPTRIGGVPWIGCGSSGQWDNVHDALSGGGLDFDVRQSKCYDEYGNVVPSVLVNINNHTGEQLGVTSKDYGIVQNDDAFSLLDPFCQTGGIIEHVGMTVNGMCFMVMRMSCHSFGLGGDGYDMFVCAMNSFNSRFPLAVIITPVRVVCQNMFRKLMKRGDTVLSIKHGRLARERLISASRATSMLVDYTNDFCETANIMQSLGRSHAAVAEFVERMFPFVPKDAKHPRADQSNERILVLRDEFMDEYYHSPDNARYEGTMFGIVNAYYDWVSHAQPVRAGRDWEDTHFSGMLSGTAINAKLLESA